MEKLNWWCVYFAQEILEPAALKRIEGYLKRLSPEVIFGKRRVFVKMEDVQKLPFAIFQMKLTAFARKYQLHPEAWYFGRGLSLTESWIQTRWGTLSPDALPSEAVLDYLSPLGTDRKSTKDQRTIRSLHALGLQSFEDVLATPEDVLLLRCNLWIDEVTREFFPERENSRDDSLERLTRASFLGYAENTQGFQLEDWIPDAYLEVG